MANPTYIINDYWLKELVLNHNPDLKNFHKEDLIKMIHFCTEEINKYKETIDKAIVKLERYSDIISEASAYGICVDLLHLLKEVE